MKGQNAFEDKMELFKCNGFDADLVNCPKDVEVQPDDDGETNVEITVKCTIDEEGCTDNGA